jgi:sulfane dehydrogenase subunit SoxC
VAGQFSDEDLKPVAGGGLLHRRLLLKRGLSFAAAVAAVPAIESAAADNGSAENS